MTAFTATSHSFSSCVNCLSSYDCINEVACVNVHVPDFFKSFSTAVHSIIYIFKGLILFQTLKYDLVSMTRMSVDRA